MIPKIFWILPFLLFKASLSQAYTVIIPSTSAPAGTEQALLAQTTTFFNATLFVNPLVPNTYEVFLNGPQISQFQIIKDSGTYAFIFGQGILTERSQDLRNLVGPDSNCDASPYCVGMSSITAPSNYITYGSTYTISISSSECQAFVCRIAGDIYLQNYSPPLILGP